MAKGGMFPPTPGQSTFYFLSPYFPVLCTDYSIGSITYSLFHIHRSTALWGPTAHEFSPERFLPSESPVPSSLPSPRTPADFTFETAQTPGPSPKCATYPTQSAPTPTRAGHLAPPQQAVPRSPRPSPPTTASFTSYSNDSSSSLPDGRYEQHYASTPYVFMPFNAGPRSCLGQQLAYAEIGVFLCRWVQKLNKSNKVQTPMTPVTPVTPRPYSPWTLDEEAIPPNARTPESWKDLSSPATISNPRRALEKIWPKSHLTMFVEGGLWMRRSAC